SALGRDDQPSIAVARQPPDDMRALVARARADRGEQNGGKAHHHGWSRALALPVTGHHHPGQRLEQPLQECSARRISAPSAARRDLQLSHREPQSDLTPGYSASVQNPNYAPRPGLSAVAVTTAAFVAWPAI